MATKQGKASRPSKILSIDIGGTKVKFLISGETEPRKIPSGVELSPARMVDEVRRQAKDWRYTAVSIGIPGRVGANGPLSEPGNLGPGWVGFDFAAAFECPVRIVNDAAMQALGSYRRGRMLFLGLGTGLGSALIIDGALEPMELAHLPYAKGRTYEEYVGKAGLKRLGKKKWRRRVADVVTRLKAALEADDVVVGGGNAKLLRSLPRGVRRGANANAFLGGYRLWTTTQNSDRRRTARRSRARSRP
jgi:polyphosphate glucokinase